MFGRKSRQREQAPPRAQAKASGRYDEWRLDEPLLHLSPVDSWTIGDACEGSLILGGTGAGKTSGSGQTLAKAMLRAGYGGLVLCAKDDECDRWLEYLLEVGRGDDVMVFGPQGVEPHRFNFLEYELTASRGMDTENLTAMFLSIAEAARGRASGGNKDEGNPFWRESATQLLSNCFAALKCAYGTARVEDVRRMVSSAPRSLQEAASTEFRERSFCVATVRQMFEAPKVPLPDHDRMVVSEFFRTDWPNRNPKTRGDVEATIDSMIFRFQRGMLHEMFCTDTTLVPEQTHDGVVIIVDMPVKEYHEAGVIAAHIWKYLWQRSVERRATLGDKTRPVFLWADECQFFVSEHDAKFQATARQKRGCSVYLSQNLETIISTIGGPHAEHATYALLENFQTRFFHANSSRYTNQAASDAIGQGWHTLRSVGGGTSHSSSQTMQRGRSSGGSYGESGGPQGGGNNSSLNYGKSESLSVGGTSGTSTSYNDSWQLAPVVLPSVFAQLGKARDGVPPEAIVTQAGRVFRATGSIWLKTRFLQS